MTQTQAQTAQTYFYTFPDCLQVVQLLALDFSFDRGFALARGGKTWPPEGATALFMTTYTAAGAEPYLRATSGTNDERAFYALFESVVVRALPGFLALLRREPWLLPYLSTFAPRPLPYMYELHRAALANRHLLDSPGNAPLPLVWPPLPQKKGGKRHGRR